MDKVSLQDLIDEHGVGWVRDRAEVRFPASRETFVSCLYRVLDQLVKNLESDANLFQGDGEEKISKILCRLLEQRGYGATAETDHRGHVDVTVTALEFTWLGEAKKHGAYDHLAGGITQLLTRYTTGREPHGGLIVYIFNKKASPVMASWRADLKAKKHAHYKSDADDAVKYCFRSTHEHQVSGDDFEVRHIGVALYYAPEA